MCSFVCVSQFLTVNEMRKTTIYCLVICTYFPCCISYFAANTKPKLLFVQILWRHGDRAQLEPYPNDPNPKEIWKEGFGMLTQVNVFSSEVDRCIKSAQANLASFFAPTPEWQFEPELQWQPITVNYLPEDIDKFIQTTKSCRKLIEEQERNENSSGITSEHQKLFNFLREKGINTTSEAYLLHDALSIQKRKNLKIPSWAESIWDELKYVADLQFNLFFSSPSLRPLQIGSLIEKIIERMKSKLEGDFPTMKFQIYSAVHCKEHLSHPDCEMLIKEHLRRQEYSGLQMDGIIVASCAAVFLLVGLITWHIYHRRKKPQLSNTVVMFESLQPEVVCRSICSQHPYYRVISEYSLNDERKKTVLQNEEE